MRRRNADVLGVLLSFTLLAMCLLAVLLGGVRIYRGLAERVEPALVLVASVMVGIILLAVMLPLLRVMSALG